MHQRAHTRKRGNVLLSKRARRTPHAAPDVLIELIASTTWESIKGILSHYPKTLAKEGQGTGMSRYVPSLHRCFFDRTKRISAETFSVWLCQGDECNICFRKLKKTPGSQTRRSSQCVWKITMSHAHAAQFRTHATWARGSFSFFCAITCISQDNLH